MALVFLVPAAETAANVRINRGVAAPVYVTVPGPTDESAAISDLAVSGFAMGGTVDVTARVRNVGTVHRDFRGPTRLTVAAPGSAAAFPDFTVPRGGTRDIGTTWDTPLMCVCHPTISFTNADGSTQSVTTRVIVFPLHLLGLAIGLVLALVVGLRLRRRHFRTLVAEAAARLTTPAGNASA
ncbi:hypothetical protein [Actinokineospora sp. NBRC 105648]|uniref:hypothetical protein n=1 Tax=Actinokineospora sp. NBRC 105648 TaxID=3032206 RepID=UPI0024A51A35|nr:hypothetical protein [Actinokineospora sp. NBRC 105648]GLZ42380.1 hypothetical protein Acsp05_60040 [Actinokineospora sp. NBRC 105648]